MEGGTAGGDKWGVSHKEGRKTREEDDEETWETAVVDLYYW